jgi:endonuclease/exonuclease/phosphatase (EEP) superfamily protein YafD
MRKLVVFIGVASAALCLFGFFGALHPALDTLALGRPFFAGMAMFGALAVIGKPRKALLLGIGVAGIVSVLTPMRAGSVDGDFLVYVKNMHHKHADIDALVKDIRKQSVNAVLLQEVPTSGSRISWMLRSEFPHQHTCPHGIGHGLVVLSKAEFVSPPRCTKKRVLAAAQISLGDTPVWLVSTHIPWPWPNDARTAEAQARTLLAGMTGPIIMAGDFNMVPWSARVTGLARAANAKRAGPSHATFFRLPVPLAIDHVLAPKGGHVTERPMFGSDHAGLVARVHLGAEP